MDRAAIQERFGIVGSTAAIHHIIDRARLVARTDITVLLSGESGVGKELVAHAIHALGNRRHKELVVVNCGALPEGLIESELFGAEKGAYTGSVERRTGFFEQADRGTIFLDEIGETPLSTQVRLLRVLENGEFSRVGSSKTIKVDTRIIAATNKDLAREVEAGRFREDLYYRLSTVVIDIPSLRERRDDIVPIFNVFLQQFAQKYDAPFKRLSRDAAEFLRDHRWPGNVRELRNVAEQAVVLNRNEVVSANDLKPYIRSAGSPTSSGLILASDARIEDQDARERELIYRMLLEIRLEMAETKRILAELAKTGREPLPVEEPVFDRPATPTRHEPTPDRRTLPATVPEETEDEGFADFIEEALYEIQTEDPEAEPASVEEKPLPTMLEAEKALILEALRRFDGNRRQTARVLGISERTLYRKLKSFDIDD